MKKYIFNEKYFAESFLGKNGCINEKLEYIEENSHLSIDSLKKKRRATEKKHAFLVDDYNLFRENNELRLLLLNVEKLIEKLFLRVDRDLSSNKRFLLYKVLSNYNVESPNFTLDDFMASVQDEKIDRAKIKASLEDCKVFIDKSGTKESLFNKEIDERGIALYSLNITVAIKYTELSF